MIRPAEIELYANTAPFALALVQATGPLVALHITEPSTRFSSTLEIHPRVARALAAALVEAADLADKEAAQ